MDNSKYPSNWKDITTAYKKKHKYICEFCGRGPLRHNPLTTHHIDGDGFYNEDSNLACLHGSCHLLFHSVYKSCRTPKVFKEICDNYQRQLWFKFSKQREEFYAEKVS